MRYVNNVNVIRNGDNIEVRDGDIVEFSCPREKYYKRKVRKSEERKYYSSIEEAKHDYPELANIKNINRNNLSDLLDNLDELELDCLSTFICCRHWVDWYDYGITRKSFRYNDNGKLIEKRIETYIKIIEPSEPNKSLHLNGVLAKKKKVPKRKNKKKHKKY